MALMRRDYVVRRYELTSVQHKLLQGVVRGLRLDEALEKVAIANAIGTENLAALVRDWFAFWASERFFASAAY